ARSQVPAAVLVHPRPPESRLRKAARRRLGVTSAAALRLGTPSSRSAPPAPQAFHSTAAVVDKQRPYTAASSLSLRSLSRNRSRSRSHPHLSRLLSAC